MAENQGTLDYFEDKNRKERRLDRGIEGSEELNNEAVYKDPNPNPLSSL